MEEKRKKDFSEDFQSLRGEVSQLASSGSQGLEEALTHLLALEKKCRLNNDFSTLKELCVYMIRVCRENQQWVKLNATLTLLSRRRAQSRVAVQALVEEAMRYIDETPSPFPSEDVKIDLIRTLKDICEGKMYVEAESARLHLMLALIFEAKGDLATACDMIQDVHVETYGSLTKKEKAEYILQQIRLNLLKKDFVRALIQSRKMNRKVLEEAELSEVKVSFYRLMIDYYMHERDPWEISLCYHKIYDTPAISEDAVARRDALESCVIFLLMSKYDNHQSDMMHRLRLIKDLNGANATFPDYAQALKYFVTQEIIPIPFSSQAALESHASLARGDCGGDDAKQFFLQLLHSRIIEHNLRVVAYYYTRIHSARLESMLGLDSLQLEQFLSDMSSSERNEIHVKIDRPAGIISFVKQRTPDAVLTDWSSDIGKLLKLLESTCHLINRENMVHKIK